MSGTLRVPPEGRTSPGEAQMRVKTLVLGSASLTMIALAASPALAQGGGPGGTVPGSTADTASPGADPAGSDAIVVTGLRRSLQSAQNLKRNATQQIDAVV